MAYKCLTITMKKTVFFLICLVATLTSHADHKTVIKNSTVTKEQCFEAVKKWTVKNLDPYNAVISYEDKSSGTLIIKGHFKDEDNDLYACKEGYIVVPYVDFQLEIQCKEGQVEANFNHIQYSYKSTYGGDYSSHSTFILKRMRNELDEIRKLMISKGEVWEIDDSFEKKYKELDERLKYSEAKKDDKSISKKERKSHERFYEENDGRELVYFYTDIAASHLSWDLINQSGTGLRDIIIKLRPDKE